ncbi:hypothetical protein AKJ09_05696 [Labilithrix luteola]|uniref:Uncharacterized protein n=1 Tax=Labilithrix luteola TaxID=1391654 RepID=A0A0K1PZW1_9BACT|nr:hypothetical protein AKJ09_05696 [Labilithrix luteola]
MFREQSMPLVRVEGQSREPSLVPHEERAARNIAASKRISTKTNDVRIFEAVDSSAFADQLAKDPRACLLLGRRASIDDDACGEDGPSMGRPTRT